MPALLSSSIWAKNCRRDAQSTSQVSASSARQRATSSAAVASSFCQPGAQSAALFAQPPCIRPQEQAELGNTQTTSLRTLFSYYSLSLSLSLMPHVRQAARNVKATVSLPELHLLRSLPLSRSGFFASRKAYCNIIFHPKDLRQDIISTCSRDASPRNNGSETPPGNQRSPFHPRSSAVGHTGVEAKPELQLGIFAITASSSC